jgi:N-methylhydantoinase A
MSEVEGRKVQGASTKGSRYRLGIDVGGTFTDLCLIDEADRSVRNWKVPSTPADPSDAMLTGIAELLDDVGATPASVVYLAHGTTVATNVLLERRGASIALLTTEGFRDVLEVARGRRDKPYDLDADKPSPLVPRELCYEVPERILFDGTVHMPVDEAAVEAIARVLRRKQVGAVAVALLHAYANPVHEQLVRELLTKYLPEASISLSSEILPEAREYERTLTTAANAYLQPRVAPYLGELVHRLEEVGIRPKPLVNSSTGGLLPVATAGERPVLTVMSGPSAGVVGAVRVGAEAGNSQIITFDMGGTSTDVALIDHGAIPVVTSKDVGGLPLSIPTADVVSIGAGGGSIARIDDGGLLKVGPESAGANPGPACYSRGGTLPTVTDAMMVLGYLNTEHLLGGRMSVDMGAAVTAITEFVAAPLALSVEEAALGILDVTRSNIEQAIRLISVRRGFDPRDFSLAAYGGAGPQHAGALADKLGIPSVIIPYAPGTLCAQGLLDSDMRTDYSQTVRLNARPEDWYDLAAAFVALEARADAWFEASGISPEDRVLERSVDMRYVGQHHQISTPVVNGLGEMRWQEVVDTFSERHRRLYGHKADAPTEVVAVRLAAIGRLDSSETPATGGAEPVSCREPSGSRRVWFGRGQAPESANVYERDALRPGSVIDGPAIVEQMDTTTVILPRQRATVHASGNLLVRVSPATRLGEADSV